VISDKKAHKTHPYSMYTVASYPGLRGEGKRRPGAHCLRMRVIREAIVT